MVLVQPLHGLTFALLHLACVQMLSVVVPPALAATAQAIYGVAVGTMTAIMTLVSGPLLAPPARAHSGSWGSFASVRCRSRLRCAESRSMHPRRIRSHSGLLLST
jgi:MFS_1 like family